MLLDKGFLLAAALCLRIYGRYRFHTTEEHVEPGTSSEVDYLGLVGDKRVVLLEAKSPSVMKMVGDSLPTDAFTLEWARNQSLVPKVLLKVSTRVPRCNTNSDDSCTCIGRFVSGSEGDGMAVPYVPQLLDRLSSHQRR